MTMQFWQVLRPGQGLFVKVHQSCMKRSHFVCVDIFTHIYNLLTFYTYIMSLLFCISEHNISYTLSDMIGKSNVLKFILLCEI